ncbi:family 10 glycosylhydrolase [candidate division KSB1 bacterium]|nr:family 10 glycosylhydrolase [candidate division KSB1 bacterium]
MVILLLSIPAFAEPPREFRAVKLTNVDSDVLFSNANIVEAMDYLASIGINVVLPVVWNGSGADGVYTLFPSQTMNDLFGRSIHPAFSEANDPLKRVIIEAHRNGIEVFPWFEMGFSSSYSQNGGHIVQKFPDWALKDRDGKLLVKNGFDWLSGINPEVQDLIISLVMEIVDHYDIDGIEFSDRIPAMPVQGGYDEVTAGIYAAEHDGAQPPYNYKDSAWMRWRADKLSEFNRMVRDSLRSRGNHLIFSSSPSIYPWSYEEYLQDSYTWVNENLVDNIIPQVYRYSYSDYVYELNKSLGYVPMLKRSIFFSGMLVKVGSYTITPEFLLDAIQANRDKDVKGEALFFYEGLRDNNNLLGDTLKATFYSEPAIVPHREDMNWRPKALIVNEDDPGAETTGTWEGFSSNGFEPNILVKRDDSYAAITYSFEIPVDGWYDIYAYIFTSGYMSTAAPYTLYAENDSVVTYINQKNFQNAGWQELGTIFLQRGFKKVIKLDNRNVPAGEYISADAAMVMINRKLSPDAIWTGVDYIADRSRISPGSFDLFPNYPNPFNAMTNIQFYVQDQGIASLKIYNVKGELVDELLHEPLETGVHQVRFDATNLSTGVYVAVLNFNGSIVSRKMIYMK